MTLTHASIARFVCVDVFKMTTTGATTTTTA